jgi:DNA gyrase subunit B
LTKDSYKVSGGCTAWAFLVSTHFQSTCAPKCTANGKVFEQEYKQGKPQYDVREIGKTTDRGTIITFLPDPEIFETDEYKFDVLAHRLRELSFLNKGFAFQTD